LTFSTLAALPTVVTGRVSDRAQTSVSFHGTINSNGAQTTYHFEYGPTTGYGSRAPAGFEASAGNARTARVVSQGATDLQPGTMYHYRLVAQNDGGTEVGEDKTFETISASAPVRAFELVSPPEKGGQNVNVREEFHAAPDGNGLSFAGQAVLHETGTEAGPLFPRYVSHRTATDWIPKPIDPPFGLRADEAWGPWYLTQGVSDDTSQAIMLSRDDLAPGAHEGWTNTYIRDTNTGQYTTVASVDDINFWIQQTNFKNIRPAMYAGGTANYSKVFIWGADTTLLPGMPASADYEYSEGQLRPVSVAPDGTVVAGGPLSTQYDREGFRVSADGSHVFFGSGGVAYVRIDNGTPGARTQVVSASRRTGEVGTPEPGEFFAASRDGETAYLLGQNLTDDSPADIRSLYRYSVASEELKFLTPVSGPGFSEVIAYGAGSTGEGLFFSSSAALAAGAVNGMANIYAWRNDELSLATSLDPARDGLKAAGWWRSPNGRYLVFASASKLTDYDPTSSRCLPIGTCVEIYRYDADTKSLDCVSCRPDGGRAGGDANIGFYRDELGADQLPKVVLNDGRVFFDSPDELVSRDTNSVSDVYEFDGADTNLVSGGDGLRSQIAAVSSDGRDVFFTTKDRLVGIDTDVSVDVYDARVGGGLASQNPPSAREECIRDDCKAVPRGGPELPFGGSEALSGPQNVDEAPKQRCGKGRHARKVRGKTRCVKQKKSSKNRANDNRRQGR
jgi:hypothetical protein